MAKTKAKAKVKPVVKNKTKAAPKKAAPAKKAIAKKAIPAKKVLVNKTKTKHTSIQKAAPKGKVVAKKAAPAKKVVVQKAKPSAKLSETKKPAKTTAVATSKIQSKTKEKAPDKKQKVEQLVTKKTAVNSNAIPEKKAKFEFPKKRAGRKPKNKGDEDDGFELLEVPKLEPISKKAPKKKFIIPVSQEIYVNPLAKPVVAPKNMGTYKKFEIEFPIHASPYIIYSFISSPAGLSEWFADNVNIRNDEYTFFWDGSQQTATLLSKKENTFMKFRWNDEPDFTFFEFRIVVDEITQDVAFWVTDFAEDEKSKEASEMLWHSQIDALIHAMGA
jgi:START-like superfamily domain